MAPLDEHEVPADPFTLFAVWHAEAAIRLPDTAALATQPLSACASPQSQPVPSRGALAGAWRIER